MSRMWSQATRRQSGLQHLLVGRSGEILSSLFVPQSFPLKNEDNISVYVRGVLDGLTEKILHEKHLMQCLITSVSSGCYTSIS